MSNRKFEMYDYRQIIHRIRMGQTDREIARTKIIGRAKCGQIRAIAQDQSVFGVYFLDMEGKKLPVPRFSPSQPDANRTIPAKSPLVSRAQK